MKCEIFATPIPTVNAETRSFSNLYGTEFYELTSREILQNDFSSSGSNTSNIIYSRKYNHLPISKNHLLAYFLPLFLFLLNNGIPILSQVPNGYLLPIHSKH